MICESLILALSYQLWVLHDDIISILAYSCFLGWNTTHGPWVRDRFPKLVKNAFY
jgi:hypothetical protein